MINKTYLYTVVTFCSLLCIVYSCNHPNPKQQLPASGTKVYIMGTVHKKHLTETSYSLEVIKKVIKAIDPDVIMVELPPQEHEKSFQSYITETAIIGRVKAFPEIYGAVYPLKKEGMSFEIIGVSAWSAQMASTRSRLKRELKNDPVWKDRFKQLKEAADKREAIFQLHGKYDPTYIHTDEYDEANKIYTSVNNDLFNDTLGAGGWENINTAHFSLMNAYLQEHSDKEVKILIMFGAAHKGWLKNKLERTPRIQLINISDYFRR